MAHVTGDHAVWHTWLWVQVPPMLSFVRAQVCGSKSFRWNTVPQEVKRFHTRGESEESTICNWWSMQVRDPPWYYIFERYAQIQLFLGEIQHIGNTFLWRKEIELLTPSRHKFLKILEDRSPFSGATDTLVLDFWWCLPLVSKPSI